MALPLRKELDFYFCGFPYWLKKILSFGKFGKGLLFCPVLFGRIFSLTIGGGEGWGQTSYGWVTRHFFQLTWYLYTKWVKIIKLKKTKIKQKICCSHIFTIFRSLNCYTAGFMKTVPPVYNLFVNTIYLLPSTRTGSRGKRFQETQSTCWVVCSV